jgi:hypothetical protein
MLKCLYNISVLEANNSLLMLEMLYKSPLGSYSRTNSLLMLIMLQYRYLIFCLHGVHAPTKTHDGRKDELTY